MGPKVDGSESSQHRRLVATAKDAALGVHTASEFLYCPRAGVISYEAGKHDSGEEVRSIRLGYLPNYDLKRIAAEIGRISLLLVLGIAISAGGIVIAGLLAITVWPAAILICWLLFLVLLVGVPCGLWFLLLLTYRHSQAVGAQPKEPEFDGDGAVPADWWGLIAAGYELRQWPDVLTIPEWKLSGRPWRVLTRGETYVPVFLRRSDRRELFKQHYARVAAYCELLKQSAWGDSPFGVILYAATVDAVAIPHTPVANEALIEGVRGMRHLVQVVASAPMLVEPGSAAACKKCPLGEMTPYSEVPLREGDRKPVLYRHGKKLYHSECGDRFNWTPPHVSAFRIGAREEA